MSSPLYSGTHPHCFSDSLLNRVASDTLRGAAGRWRHRLMQEVVTACCTFAVLCASPTLAQDAPRRGVLLNFSSVNCGPCQRMSPIVRQLQEEGLPVRKIDTDQQPDLAQRYQITSIPAFVLVVDGKEVDRRLGACTENDLRQMVARIPTGASAQTRTQQPQSQQFAALEGSSASDVTPSDFGNLRLGAPAEWPGTLAPRVPLANTPAASAPTGRAPQFPALLTGSNGNTSAPRATVVRGNNPDQDARPLAATTSVRLRIKEKVTTGDRDSLRLRFGSGTMIDSRRGVTTILTSGHLLEQSGTEGTIEVDVFTTTKSGTPRAETYLARVIGSDLEADVGLVAINTPDPMPVARLATGGSALQQGQNLSSWGCSGGDVPTTEAVKLTALNYYDGPENIECSGPPMSGRSGGGLFSASGDVVGVCIGANQNQAAGVYSALAPVMKLLRRCGYEHLAPSAGSGVDLAANTAVDNQPGLNPTDELQLARDALASAPDAEIILIVRSKTPGQPSRAMVVHSATSKLRGYLFEDPSAPAAQNPLAATANGSGTVLTSAYRSPR